MLKMNCSRTDSVLIFFGSLLLFTFGLQNQEVVGFDSRLYAFGLELWRHGFGWFPRTFQQYYPDYPVTASLMIYYCALLAGTYNKLIAVLPSAIAASLTLVVTYLIGSLKNRQWGYSAVILLLFTLEFTFEARSISYDQYITLITCGCFYLIYSARMLHAPKRIYWLFPLFVIGFAFRGPIGLVLPTGVVSIFYLLNKEWKKFFIVGVSSALLLVICTLMLLFTAYHMGGNSFLQEVLHTEVLNHIHDLKSNPFYFYFIEGLGSYAITFPLMLLMLPGVIAGIKQKESNDTTFLVYLLGWIFVIFIGLSVPDDKKMRYILPSAPALALFCAYLFVNIQSNTYLRVLRQCCYWLCYFFPTICLLALIFFLKKLMFAHLHYLTLIGMFLVLQVLMFFCFLYYREKIILILFLGMTTFLSTDLSIVEPVVINLNSTRDFVMKVNELRDKEHARIVFYHEGWDGIAVKYFINLPREEQLYFIDTPAQLMAYPKPAIFIASKEYVAALPAFAKQQIRQVMSGKIGRDEVIVFRRD